MYQHNKIENVIFDLGNVVLNWDVEQILQSLNLDTTTSKLLRTELFHHQDWIDLDHGKITESEVINKICHRSSLSKNVIGNALSVGKNSLTLIEKTITLMEDISRINLPMYCLSNMSRETYSHIAQYSFFEMFKDIYISGIEGYIKPNEDIFLKMLARFKIEPSKTLFIDDSFPNIFMARSLEINGIHFNRSDLCYEEIRKIIFKT